MSYFQQPKHYMSELNGFLCRWVLPLNVEVGKIMKFFNESQSVTIILSPHGIFFSDIIEHRVLFSAGINKADVYQFKCADPSWSGIVRQFPFPALQEMVKNVAKDSNKYFLSLSLTKDMSILRVDIIKADSKTICLTKDITLSLPEKLYETPEITFANVTISIQDFKILCSVLSKRQDVKVFYQDDYVRFDLDTSSEEFGIINPDKPVCETHIDGKVFRKAIDMNMGNIKNGNVGIYVQNGLPIIFKVKLGSIDFNIYGTTFDKN